MPPAGAAVLIATVAVEFELLPMTSLGASDSDDTTSGSIETEPLWLVPRYVAVTLTVCVAETSDDVTVKVPVV